jgi:4'-phosphopantetheinyl transferase EntD
MAAAKKLSTLIKAAPTIKIVLCGPHTIYWVPDDIKLEGDILKDKLHPEEIKLSAKTKAKPRKDEFLRARWLFHKVTKSPEPLLRNAGGDPKWPANMLGSISHKDGHVMYTRVSPETHYSIGLDVEKLKKVKAAFQDKICDAEEAAILDRILVDPKLNREDLLALFFSVKESIYKAHYPLGKKHFGFHDATVIAVDLERREVKVRLNIKSSNETPKGHICTGYYNWTDYKGEKFVITTVEERKPIVMEPLLTKDDEEADAKAPAVVDLEPPVVAEDL